MPIRELRGFERVAIAAGERQRVSFRLRAAEAFGHYDEAQRAFVVDPGTYEIEVGASSRDIRLSGQVRVGRGD
jgi:beta-glucosidase